MYILYIFLRNIEFYTVDDLAHFQIPLADTQLIYNLFDNDNTCSNRYKIEYLNILYIINNKKTHNKSLFLSYLI